MVPAMLAAAWARDSSDGDGQGTGRKRMATSSTGAPYHANLATTAAGGDVVLRKLLS
jgi:hypothetical protein